MPFVVVIKFKDGLVLKLRGFILQVSSDETLKYSFYVCSSGPCDLRLFY